MPQRKLRKVNWDIDLADITDPADTTDLENALFEYNYETTGYRDGRAFSWFRRDQTGRMVAGIDGFTWGGYAWVEYLWVDESLRGQGLGRALLSAAEEEARRRGCRTIALQTHEFQAPSFYPKLGYIEVGATVDTPIGYRELLFQKRL
jgi:GNAT superfamily N-acetyltransferase